MKESLSRLVSGVKGVSDFLSDALEAFKDSKFIETIEKAAPALGLLGEISAEAVPPVKFITKLTDELLKETDPEKLGFTACTIAFQNAVVIALKEVGGPDSEKQSIKVAKERLREVGNFEDVDMGTLTIETALQSKFYERSMQCFQSAARSVGYVDRQIEKLTSIIQEKFQLSLVKLLSQTSDANKDKFLPFKTYMALGGPEQKRARKMLAQHANYQRWLFEQAPVLKVSPFALKHIYIDTDCISTTWGEVNKTHLTAEDRAGILSDSSENRQPLLETVMNLIKEKRPVEAIVIQGTAGSGKSSFTLKLFDELLKHRLHPIRVRIGDLSFDSNTHIEDELPKAVVFGDENFLSPSYAKEENLFLNGSIFAERGVGEFEHISKYVLILDGWDEISLSNEGFKNKVAQMLTQLNDSYLKKFDPYVRVILTGRPSSDIGDTKCLRERSPFLNIVKFTPAQLKGYIQNLRQAANTKSPLIPKTTQTEQWVVPDEKRFEPIIEKYEEAFESRQDNASSELDILGLPLLTYLTVRLVAEWKGNLAPLIENTTTLYRHLIDLTCQEAGKIGDESRDQYKIYGEDLRRLLWKTAHAITLSGSENISRWELISRLDAENDGFNQKLSELDKENKLSSLLISFYFKGGHSNLGCEFAHKSFREYLFAENIVETLKTYGRNQKNEPQSRANYWDDFPENNPKDMRYKLSRELAMLLAPQWITPEVSRHLQQLIKWEIERSTNLDKSKRPGSPTTSLVMDEWQMVRDALADLWGWWGEGAHMRPQRYRHPYKGTIETRPAYVNDLIEWDAPRDDRIENWNPARTITIDAHLGDGLFLLCATVYAEMFLTVFKGRGQDKLREYQSLREINGNPTLAFKPTGSHRDYFRNYAARINSAGWRPEIFPSNLEMKYIDFSHCDLSFISFDYANLHHATFSKAWLSRTAFYYANAENADFSSTEMYATDLFSTNLTNVNFTNSSFRYANLTYARIDYANFQDASFMRTNLQGVQLNNSTLQTNDFENTIFETIENENKTVTRESFFKFRKKGRLKP